MILTSTDGRTWTRVFYETGYLLYDVATICGCPEYSSASVNAESARSFRRSSRRTLAESGGIHPAGGFTDNMWCRRGDPSVAGQVDVRGVRTNGR